jgi:cellulose synthase/poly-beta-1,6-N-acetylglucosamine synthase-like glycosyltransferase
MELTALVLIAGCALLALYTYIGYPALLALVARRDHVHSFPPPAEWPMISISVPAYNEAGQIRGVIESLLDLDYPADRRQILIISDASTDGTDEIVNKYSDRGVELLRQPVRMGKTAGENAARSHLRGEIVVNTDASIRIHPRSLKPLIARFSDSTIGLASGRDVSVTAAQKESNASESSYVGYEMGVRRLETRVHSIVGASGCFYAIRAHLHGTPLPDALSRDFASAMITREHGYRAVSVDEAICFVPRTSSLRREYSRKVRTITRGMETLWHKKALLNPVRYSTFSWMLFSHKICRWVLPWSFAAAFIGLGMLTPLHTWAAWLWAATLVALAVGAAGCAFADRYRIPRILLVPAYLLAGNAAAMHAAVRAMRGHQNQIWEPTRREAVVAR